jgi:hypothetical protein
VTARAYRILVTGSRIWDDECAVWQALAETALAAPDRMPVTVVHGACPHGADAHAARWARAAAATGRRPVTEEPHPADWGSHSSRAGIIRNTLMVDLGADVCLAFIRGNSRGATHTAALAEKAGIPVRRWTA